MKEDLRIIKTRENIESHLLDCLQKLPFEDISVKMLVEQSRINRSTFYRNYDDKYQLLQNLINNLLEGLKDRLDVRFIAMQYKNAAKYHPSLRPLAEYFLENRKAFLTLWNAALPVNFYNLTTELFSNALLNSMETNYKISSQNHSLAQLYAELFAAHTIATFRWWLDTEPILPLKNLLEIMTNNIEKGLFYSMEQLFEEVSSNSK